tara:strand:+ start:9631 stop:11025 length:1395 start_codon:yes stop_codon:yes gene_type:complete
MAPLKTLIATSALLLPLLSPVVASSLLGGCGEDPDPVLGPDDDIDGDGFSANEGDCNDDNLSIYPGAPDPCDGIDQNCDGVPDELFDQDNDNYTTCNGDCRDNDNTSNPGASEVVDGLDNDCDGIADNHTDQYDDDGDGYSEDQGDCNDQPTSGGAFIGPDAIEVAETPEGEPELIDNDCDGIVDEAVEACPTDLEPTDPLALAAALDVCNEVIQASIDPVVDDRSYAILDSFGDTYVPFAGPDFTVLSSGIAGDTTDPLYAGHSSDMGNTILHPAPATMAPICGSPDEAEVNDYSEVSLALQVPQNAQAFSFDFNFMSIEFPEYVCTSFDDTFIAYLESEAFTGNVSFDSMGSRVSINVGFFTVCEGTAGCTGEADLLGTGFESGADGGGGTGWLTTTAPVVPGEKINLTFMIFDEGDRILDSTVLLDNFRWELEAIDGPITEGREFKREFMNSVELPLNSQE